MYKRYISVILIVILSFSLIGCGNEIPDMSEEQSVLVANYAATLLLKYDKGYQTQLLNQEQLEKEEALQAQIKEEAKKREAAEAARAERENNKDTDSENGSNVVTDDSIVMDPAEFLNLSGVSVSFNGVEYSDIYPNDDNDLLFTINASPGCQVAIVKLRLINNTSDNNSVDVFGTNARFKVSLNGGDYHSIMSTAVLENDFSSYSGEIAPQSYVDTVLLIDLKEEECKPADSVDLYIKYQNDTTKIKLK